MARAVELSRAGAGWALPNPVVGCVVLDPDGDIVGEGWHAKAGGPHAEVVALEAAGDRARGATVVVTLEPCRHTGRTGPCTQALIEAGVSRLVYAVADPNPAAAGGAAELLAAGIEVEGAVLETEAAAANIEWLTAAREQRPHVTLKLASSVDGRIAAADGTSRWITGPAARADAHRLRALSDAVLVGTGTALADDPALTVRDVDAELAGRRPLRVVMGLRDLPLDARVLAGDAPSLRVGSHDPVQVLKVLHDREVRAVLVEGGATVASAFLAAGLVDRVVAYVAPVLIGEGASAVTGFGAGTIGESLRLDDVEVTVLGDDVRIVGRPRPHSERSH
jgi:diaminohydroxyphosphoribosylaminopyrimidine deaminase/5-amino-6-(5-phosphoribosylamino)uracil reductase